MGMKEAEGSGGSGEILSGWLNPGGSLKEVSFVLSLEGWVKK